MELIFTLLFGALLCFYLFVPPQIGLADSADFGRITTRLGLFPVIENPSDRFFNFFIPRYEIVDGLKVPTNVGQVFGMMSLGINRIFQTDRYSIFYLAFIYFVLYTGGFYLFLKNAFNYFEGADKRKILFGILSVLVFSDIMFVSYFNSFYMEAVFIIAALYAVALVIEPRVKYNWLLIILLVLSLSKSQNILFLIFPISIMVWKFQNLNKIVLLSAILVSSFFLFFLLREQKNTDQPNLYEAVFLGLMTNASRDSQEKILKDLELQEKGYLINVNKGYWRPGNELIENEQLYNEFYSVVSQKDIIKVYLMNPSILLNTATKGLKVLNENSAQPDHLGNYSKKFSKQEQKTVVRSLWGIFLNNLFLPIYLVGLSTALVFPLKKRRNSSSYGRLEFLIFFLVLWIPVLYSAIFVAGGINDFVKHNLPVYFLISVLFLLIWIMLLKKNSEQLNSIVVNPSHGES